MKNIDLSLAGNYLHASDNLNSLENFLSSEENDFSQSAMRCAFSALHSRIGKALDIKEDTFNQLSNANKFYLARGAFPEREQEIRAFILERFYKFIS